jgi:hypothetical protein
LNQNLILAHVAFAGFFALWNLSRAKFWTDRRRNLAGGFAGGLAVLIDYSGVVALSALFVYALSRAAVGGRTMAARTAVLFAAGSALPLMALWFYQWHAFGNAFLPAQHWIQVQWVDVGYKGLSLPGADLLWSNLMDYRYGLFASCPLLLLAAAAPFLRARGIGTVELLLLLGIPVGLWLFSSCVAYARLQFNTGIRYMAPAIPFLFVAVALVLHRLPLRWAYSLAALSVAQGWSMAMYRDVERGLGVLDPVLHVFLGGFQLPLLTVISRISGPHAEYFAQGVSPLPLFALAAVLLFGIWAFQPRLRQGDGS